MSSNLKSQTARINGAKSKGPKTPEGKARSSQNAVRHGLTAESPTLPTESEEEFQTLLDAYLRRYHPADAIETELVQTLAITRWRLRRIGMLESALFEIEMVQSPLRLQWVLEDIRDETRLALAFSDLAGKKALDLLIRYEAALARSYDRALKQLDQLRNRELRNEPTEPLTRLPAQALPRPWRRPLGPDPTIAIPEIITPAPPEPLISGHNKKHATAEVFRNGPRPRRGARTGPVETQRLRMAQL